MNAATEFATIQLENGQELAIATSPAAAQYKVGILAARAQKFIMDQLDKFEESGATLAPGELENLVSTVEKTAKLQLAQFGMQNGKVQATSTPAPISINIGGNDAMRAVVGAAQEPTQIVDLSSAPMNPQR